MMLSSNLIVIIISIAAAIIYMIIMYFLAFRKFDKFIENQKDFHDQHQEAILSYYEQYIHNSDERIDK